MKKILYKNGHTRKKILLVRVPGIEYGTFNKDIRSLAVAGLVLPLGITYLASTIRASANYDVHILDLYAEYYEECISEYRKEPDRLLALLKASLIDHIASYRPDIIGFSAVFMFQHPLIKFCQG